MTFVWFLLSFLTIATNRWFALFWRKRQIMHSIFGFAATILTVWSGSIAIFQLNGIDPGIHEILGTLITSFVIFITALGMASMILRKLSVWNTKTMKLV